MKLPPILQKLHEKVTWRMYKSRFVENVLIAKVTDDNGVEQDCIYCTIIRNAVLFACIGGVFGFILGRLL